MRVGRVVSCTCDISHIPFSKCGTMASVFNLNLSRINNNMVLSRDSGYDSMSPPKKVGFELSSESAEVKQVSFHSIKSLFHDWVLPVQNTYIRIHMYMYMCRYSVDNS